MKFTYTNTPADHRWNSSQPQGPVAGQI